MSVFRLRTLITLSFLSVGINLAPLPPTTIPILISQAQTETPLISEAEVNTLLDHMKAAVKQRDAKALSSYFTLDATIEIYFPLIMGGKQTLKRSAYEKMLREGWQALDDSDYSYTIKNIAIKLYPEKDRALVSDETHESFVLAGKRIHSVAEENMLIVRHQGQLKVKVLKGKVKLNP